MASQEQADQQGRRRMALGGSFDQNLSEIDELVSSAADGMRLQTVQTTIREEEEDEMEAAPEALGEPRGSRITRGQRGRRRSHTDPFQARGVKANEEPGDTKQQFGVGSTTTLESGGDDKRISPSHSEGGQVAERHEEDAELKPALLQQAGDADKVRREKAEEERRLASMNTEEREEYEEKKRQHQKHEAKKRQSITVGMGSFKSSAATRGRGRGRGRGKASSRPLSERFTSSTMGKGLQG